MIGMPSLICKRVRQPHLLARKLDRAAQGAIRASVPRSTTSRAVPENGRLRQRGARRRVLMLSSLCTHEFVSYLNNIVYVHKAGPVWLIGWVIPPWTPMRSTCRSSSRPTFSSTGTTRTSTAWSRKHSRRWTRRSASPSTTASKTCGVRRAGHPVLPADRPLRRQ